MTKKATHPSSNTKVNPAELAPPVGPIDPSGAVTLAPDQKGEPSPLKFVRRQPHQKTPPPGIVYFDAVVQLDGALHYLLWLDKGAMRDYKERMAALLSPAAEAQKGALEDQEESNRIEQERQKRLKAAKGKEVNLSDLDERDAQIVQVNTERLERIEAMPDEMDEVYNSTLIGRWVGCKTEEDESPIPYNEEIIRNAPRPIKVEVLEQLTQISQNGKSAKSFLAAS